MKNISITVNDDLYRHARICAAQFDTSFTALIHFFKSLENGPGVVHKPCCALSPRTKTPIFRTNFSRISQMQMGLTRK
jgi:hypothetical protein